MYNVMGRPYSHHNGRPIFFPQDAVRQNIVDEPSKGTPKPYDAGHRACRSPEPPPATRHVPTGLAASRPPHVPFIGRASPGTKLVARLSDRSTRTGAMSLSLPQVRIS